MMARLWVFLSERRVGTLDEQNGRLTFSYEQGVTAPLSVTLPLRDEPYDDAQCRAFFSNLLPEGGWRQSLCRQLRIDERNDFALLRALGSECAGAVTLDEDPGWTPGAGVYKKTSVQALRHWVLNPAARPSLQATPGLRLSLAGAQDKLLIHLDEGVPYLCEGGAPSSVILKPDIRDLHNAVELSGFNELLSATLARQCGLKVAEPFWLAAAYAVHRYDRAISNGKPVRLHQEDFAQIAGVPAENKYEENGGPGWKSVFAMVDAHAAVPARDRLELLNRLFFNVCLGNNDAHSKNFALLHNLDGRRPSLAPAYDLVCTMVYPALSKDMAMQIGGQSNPRDLTRENWTRFCKEAGFAFASVRKLGTEMANKVNATLSELEKMVTASFPEITADIYPNRKMEMFYRRYAKAINQNAGWLIKSLN